MQQNPLQSNYHAPRMATKNGAASQTQDRGVGNKNTNGFVPKISRLVVIMNEATGFTGKLRVPLFLILSPMI
jgi:hypothetical protein